MDQCEYIVAIEKVGRSEPSTNDGRLRFEFSSCIPVVATTGNGIDTNNNKKDTCIRNLTCFELQEQWIRSIRVAPAVDETFTVESVKGNGPDPTKSLSVQIIHKRNGTFRDSNENLSVYLQPIPNYIPECRPRKLSTFQVSKKNEDSSFSESSLRITETDLRDFSQFTFRFSPISEPKQSVNNSSQPSQTAVEEMPHSSNRRNMADGPSFNELEWNVNTQNSASTITFNTVLDNLISITIEVQNLLFLKTTEKLPNTPLQCKTNKTLPHYFAANMASNFDKKPKFRDLQEVVKTQAMYEHDKKMSTVVNSPSQKSRNANRIIMVRRFVKSMVIYRLLSLGVQQLDCNDIIDAWEAKQLDTYWYYTLPDDDDLRNECFSNWDDISPSISKPSSSLFRLSPSGHISKSIFSTFVRQVDTLKGILNSATCSLIQTSVLLLLPEIKLLWGRQLETNRNPIFIQEWIRLIMLAAKELKPVAPEEVVLMVNRELKTLKALAEDLYKATKKIHRKLGNLSTFSEEIFRKTLVRLNPKTLRKLYAFDVALKKKYSPDVIHFEPSKLHQIRISPTDLFRNHIFISETKEGNLLIKNDIDGFWLKFVDLKFDDRRMIFLALSEDLQINLRASLNTIQHLQEIYTAGYPGSIKNLLKDVVDELNLTSKRGDLTLLIKTSIVTHVSCLHEMLTRLVGISEEVEGVTKNFNQNLQNTSFNISKLKKQKKKKKQNTKKSTPEFSDTDTCSFGALKGYHKDCTTGINNSNPQLAIPFSHANADLIFKNFTI